MTATNSVAESGDDCGGDDVHFFQECDSWRDEAGFIVTDRNRFAYVTFDARALISSLSPSTGMSESMRRLGPSIVVLTYLERRVPFRNSRIICIVKWCRRNRKALCDATHFHWVLPEIGGDSCPGQRLYRSRTRIQGIAVNLIRCR